MKIIDADTHVDESESTWLGGADGYAQYMPITVTPKTGDAGGANAFRSRWWLVEGRLQPRAVRDDATHPPRERRELEDVPGRLRHMDEMGVDVQIIFPTFFIRYGTTNAEAEYALTTTYNRWLADKCESTNGRLRWACVLPFLQPEKAAEELRWAKAHGACGIFKRGLDLDRPVNDSHFFPVYEEASALDIPLCLHTGHPLPGREWDRGFPIMSAVTSLVSAKIPDKFPKLRFGLIEAGASWIPYTVSQRAALKRQQARRDPYYLPLGKATDFPTGKLCAFLIDGQEIAVVRDGEALYAFSNVCTHQQAYLTDGYFIDGQIICAYHEATYDPSTGAVLYGPAFEPLPVFSVRVNDGEVELEWPQPLPASAVTSIDLREDQPRSEGFFYN